MCLTSFQRSLRVERLGRVAYGPMHELQKQRHDEVSRGDADDTLFLLEHNAVITLGKNTGENHVLADASLLQSRGIDVVPTGRGGDVTYHGPGQLVCYPIVQLQDEERDIKRYVTYLEEVMIRSCRDFGIDAHRVAGLRGIWVGNDKIGAIGVRLAQWTTLHGLALNVSTNLDDFDFIVPCGIQGRGVTSIQKLLGVEQAPRLDVVESKLLEHFTVIFDRRPYDAAATPLPEADARAKGPQAGVSS